MTNHPPIVGALVSVPGENVCACNRSADVHHAMHHSHTYYITIFPPAGMRDAACDI